MRSGLSNRIVGQAGEFAVCAELGKRGLVATPFSGNVPEFDVIVVDEFLNCVPVQVKASKQGQSWITGDVEQYCELEKKDGHQKVLSVKEPMNPDLIMVYVGFARNEADSDRFYVLTKRELYHLVSNWYQEWLNSVGGVRPKNPDSTHSAIFIPHLEPYEDRWELISEQLASLRTLRNQSLGSG